MRVLLDECLPRRLARELPGHDVRTVPEAGWAGARNGELLRLAESACDVFLTVDASMAFQQDVRAVGMAIVTLKAPSNKLEDLRPLMRKVRELLAGPLKPGTLIRVDD
jgi:predicted nuclease of predicted toxin-antitoxin system